MNAKWHEILPPLDHLNRLIILNNRNGIDFHLHWMRATRSFRLIAYKSVGSDSSIYEGEVVAAGDEIVSTDYAQWSDLYALGDFFNGDEEGKLFVDLIAMFMGNDFPKESLEWVQLQFIFRPIWYRDHLTQMLNERDSKGVLALFKGFEEEGFRSWSGMSFDISNPKYNVNPRLIQDQISIYCRSL